MCWMRNKDCDFWWKVCRSRLQSFMLSIPKKDTFVKALYSWQSQRKIFSDTSSLFICHNVHRSWYEITKQSSDIRSHCKSASLPYITKTYYHPTCFSKMYFWKQIVLKLWKLLREGKLSTLQVQVMSFATMS